MKTFFNPLNVEGFELPRNVSQQVSNVAELRFQWKNQTRNVPDLLSNVSEQRNVSQLRFQ